MKPCMCLWASNLSQTATVVFCLVYQMDGASCMIRIKVIEEEEEEEEEKQTEMPSTVSTPRLHPCNYSKSHAWSGKEDLCCVVFSLQ